MGEALGVGVTEGLGVGEGVGEGETCVAGRAFLMTTPLSHVSFFPLLIHVNFLPFEFLVIPALVQIAPALGGVAAIAGTSDEMRRRATKITLILMEENDKS